MNQSEKTLLIWGNLENSLLQRDDPEEPLYREAPLQSEQAQASFDDIFGNGNPYLSELPLLNTNVSIG